MRLDFTAAFSLLLAQTLVNAHSTSSTNHNSNRRRGSPHPNRREGFFRDVGVALSDLLASRSNEKAPLIETKKAIKRSGGHSTNQCILRPAKGLIGTSLNSANGTTTSSQGFSPAHSSSTRTSSSFLKGGKTSTSATSSSSPASSTPASPWTKAFDASGSDFFDSWSFFTGADPTNGNVNFVSLQTAESDNLISIDSNGNAIMRVDPSSGAIPTRNSVRIESTTAFTGGLWILDALHMPSGCGTWPAFWSHGPDWPANGEIDIVEGVNGNTYNQASLHTKSGCTLPTSFGGTGTMVDGSDCGSGDVSNQGCGIMDNDAKSYGSGFNSNNGGVYASLWDDTGIRMWFFERNSIPADITSQSPQPGTWGTPFAIWPASSCAPFTYNNDHTTIFDTTLCGDWAGNSWTTTPNSGGQSCAASTGFPSCAAYMASNSPALSEAYWQVKSVRIYQTN